MRATPEPTPANDELARLRLRLESLPATLDMDERLKADPVAFVHRYGNRHDAEIAAMVASSLAFGRVALFRPVLASLFAEADRHGGPRPYVERFDPVRHGAPLRPLFYRWVRGSDLVLLYATLRAVIEDHGSLEALFRWRAGEADVGPALRGAVDELMRLALRSAPDCGLSAREYADLPRGFRALIPSPRDGSACKRWNMFLRWMVRPADGVDLGLWRAIPRSALVVPLDTHVARIARFLGLTRRTDNSWRTAVEITAALRRLDPEDPIRFDFAMAHLGISGACVGRFHPQTCPACPLVDLCVEAITAS